MIPAISHAQTPNLTDQCDQIASDKEKEKGVCECIASTIASGGKFSHEDKDEQFSPEELKTFEESTFESILNYEKGENIADKVQETPVILGTIRQVEDKLFNTAAVLQNGEVIVCRDKTHLPTYDVFDEARYFVSADSRIPVELKIHGKSVKLGIEICEDLWDKDYETKVSRELIHAGAEILINISASPFHVNRLDERLDIIKDKSIDLKCYFIYCNLVGAQDELVFDGQSCVVSPSGDLVAISPAFREDIQIMDIENCESVNRPEFSEEKQIFHALSLGVRDYFIKTGHKKAVLGVSGGIDSALTAVIASDALGSENVLGISMPSIYSSDHSIEDAKALAENLGIDFQIIPIKKINEQMLEDLSPVLNGSPAGLAEENIQARGSQI